MRLFCWFDPLHLANRLLEREINARKEHARGILLDAGCGSQPYRPLFDQVREYVGLDLPPNPAARVHGDALALPFRDGAFDTVLSNQVLEHVPEPLRLMREAARVLKPGGILLLTTPQTWGLHREPHDYFRFTKYGLRYLAERSDFEVLDIAPTSGLWATWAQRFADTVIFTYFRSAPRLLIKILSLFLAPVLIMGYALDLLFGKRGDTLDYVMIARKLDGRKS
jgi:SAM-dependent methyltransferase